MDKELQEISKKLIKRFEKNKEKNTNSYKCYDCYKELGDLNFTEEQKKKCPRTIDGHYLVICNECGKKDDEDY